MPLNKENKQNKNISASTRNFTFEIKPLRNTYSPLFFNSKSTYSSNSIKL